MLEPISPSLELPAGRPMLLLGIDGVINVFQCNDARETLIAPYLPLMKMLPGVQQWLQQLDRAFYLAWCSQWGRLVNRDAAGAWGLEPRPCIEDAEGAGANWKLRAVQRALAGWPGPLAWVEDGFAPETRAWAAHRLAGGARTWLVDVSETGLTAQVTQDLLEWAHI